MCDTLCVIRPTGALFAKNSDRPPGEPQLIEGHPARPAGGTLPTTHIEIENAGAFALVGSRPDWMWGMEQGVNERGVAIGNEKVWTTLDPAKEPAALIGMDLVRLGLERGATADGALDAITTLLERPGQGGVCAQTTGESYFSSFIIADGRGGWILETSGRTWVAAPIRGSAAISNRLTIRTEWTRSSAGVPAGADWDAWRHPKAPTGHSDVRLAASRACIAQSPEALTPASLVAHLRNHGSGPWGAPGSGDAPTPIPHGFGITDGTGFSVCMHIRHIQNTTSSIVAELPSDGSPPRVWVAPGQPCVNVFVPVFLPHVPAALADPAIWRAFEALRNRVESDESALAKIRAVLGPLEAELWTEADEIATRPPEHATFAARAWQRIEAARANVAERL